jgi:hypothetical protein
VASSRNVIDAVRSRVPIAFPSPICRKISGPSRGPLEVNPRLGAGPAARSLVFSPLLRKGPGIEEKADRLLCRKPRLSAPKGQQRKAWGVSPSTGCRGKLSNTRSRLQAVWDLKSPLRPKAAASRTYSKSTLSVPLTSATQIGAL